MGWFEERRESDLRRGRARTLYDFEVECRRQGWGDPAFVYDEEHDLFRWTDGASPSLYHSSMRLFSGNASHALLRRPACHTG